LLITCKTFDPIWIFFFLNNADMDNLNTCFTITSQHQSYIHVTVANKYFTGPSFVNPLTPELNPSAQRCLPRFFYWDFNF
jgi:hypothetical protein